MLRNFFKVTIRNLWRNKGFSAINIAGLAIGMAAAILILLWVQNELSYDRFHEKADRTYLLYSRDGDHGKKDVWGRTSSLVAPALKQDYGEVENAVRFRIVYFLMTVGETHLNVQGAFADSGFLSVFSYPMLKGNANNTLADPSGIILTEKLAIKLFGREDPVGKTVRIDSADNFKVAGVLKDLPGNTGLGFEYLLPWTYLSKLGWDQHLSWGITDANTYVVLKHGASQKAFDAKIKNIVTTHVNKGELPDREVFAHPLSREHLYSKADNGQLVDGRITTVRLFTIIAAFILLIACINFMNLSTARSEKRAKEVGIRKVVGAFKSSLILQFIGESVILAGFAFIIALCIVKLCLDGFNQVIGASLDIDFGNGYFWLFAMAFVLLTGLLAGSYPAFYLSASRPVKVLKGTFKQAHAVIAPRKILVVLQFSFAIILIISTIIVKYQIQHAQNRDAGYKRDNLVYTFTQGDMNNNYDLIKRDLLNSGAVLAVTKINSPMVRAWNHTRGYSWAGSTEADKKTDFLQFAADADFIKTTGTRLLQGRDIDIKNYPTDSTAMLLNEATVKEMRLQDPVGKIIRSDNGINYHVIGVVKDFIVSSPYEEVRPMIILSMTEGFGAIHFRFNPVNSTADNLAKAEKVFKQYNPQYPFEYFFTDEWYAHKFQDEQQTGTLAALFAGLAIFISCLGLFGLAAYMAESRTKEIGLRKVLGASVASITILVSKDFIKLVMISIIVASPVAFFAMSKWLQDYSYRIQIGWWIFVLAGSLAIFIALLTVSYQAIKAARANPVKSLRSE
jgi:putative ABC transport system permease protein